MTRRTRLAWRLALATVTVTLLGVMAAQSPAPARVVAIGDVHGAYPQLVALLQHARLIDNRLQWIGGSAVLVQTGDLLDRGARSRECLDLMMALEPQARRSGGAVMALLGNHEVMNVVGQLGYVTPDIYRSFGKGDSEKRRQQALREYVAFLTAHAGHGHSAVAPTDEAGRTKWLDEHPPGFVEHRDAFGPKGKYGRWLRTHRAVVQIGRGVFLHGGLSPAFGIPSIRELDERVVAELGMVDSIWQALANAKIIWRYMTLAEATTFVGEEAAWWRTGATAPAPAVATAAARLLEMPKWMVASFPEGPLWYRELSEAPDEPLAGEVATMLTGLGVQYAVVGHTPQAKGEIVPRFGSRVFLIDTGMLPEVYKGRATALEIQDGRFTALSLDAPPVELPAPSLTP